MNTAKAYMCNPGAAFSCPDPPLRFQSSSPLIARQDGQLSRSRGNFSRYLYVSRPRMAQGDSGSPTEHVFLRQWPLRSSGIPWLVSTCESRVDVRVRVPSALLQNMSNEKHQLNPLLPAGSSSPLLTTSGVSSDGVLHTDGQYGFVMNASSLLGFPYASPELCHWTDLPPSVDLLNIAPGCTHGHNNLPVRS